MIEKTPLYINGEQIGDCLTVKLSQDQNGFETRYVYHVEEFDKKIPELNERQQLFLKDLEWMWSERDQHDLSCKTSAVFEVLDCDFDYKVYGTEIDDVVKIFMSEKIQ
ncbi:hypothetical protein ABQE16_16955 [Enterococcus avium]|uniref:hypothetical protein n=1 Tax=Enterococcus TaxID=1350 RepID=UPI0007F3F0F5|nr:MULTISPECIES: hypothetical protein [Enterococcus]SAM78296.1 hypothetical protein DTPHA_1405928 [Enterococcus faecium]MZJ57093.1 hypothetical protein [Enterococcus avium]MZJ77560.1 hypothetical protein [Enterococcus avium]MZJ81819.1 hypothetical protein [Enterococcus avium]MZJ88134.1 hypothetical protein [Enterococcus avium]